MNQKKKKKRKNSSSMSIQKWICLFTYSSQIINWRISSNLIFFFSFYETEYKEREQDISIYHRQRRKKRKNDYRNNCNRIDFICYYINFIKYCYCSNHHYMSFVVIISFYWSSKGNNLLSTHNEQQVIYLTNETIPQCSLNRTSKLIDIIYYYFLLSSREIRRMWTRG
jgi:hypothetical protein